MCEHNIGLCGGIQLVLGPQEFIEEKCIESEGSIEATLGPDLEDLET